jgi:hypothetical protein
MITNDQRKSKYLAVLVAAAVIAWLAPRSVADAQIPHSHGMVQGKTPQGFAYMMGGVGSEEREIMESQARNYNFKLAFAEKAGVYLANVDVSVHDRAGKQVMNVTSNGPWLYLQLPEGAYTVRAAFNDKIQSINNLVVKPGQRAARVLRWDLPEDFPIYARVKQGQN